MPEERHLDRPNIRIEQWQPSTPETDQSFFERVVPELRALKERHLRNPANRRPMSEDQIQASLQYLENRLRALQRGDAVPIARAGDEIRGFIIVRWEDHEKRTQIEQFYVDNKYRGAGTGTTILQNALQHARAVHVGESKGVFLTTNEVNSVQRLYARSGFHPSNISAEEPGEVRLELDFEAY